MTTSSAAFAIGAEPEAYTIVHRDREVNRDPQVDAPGQVGPADQLLYGFALHRAGEQHQQHEEPQRRAVFRDQRMNDRHRDATGQDLDELDRQPDG